MSNIYFKMRIPYRLRENLETKMCCKKGGYSERLLNVRLNDLDRTETKCILSRCVWMVFPSVLLKSQCYSTPTCLVETCEIFYKTQINLKNWIKWHTVLIPIRVSNDAHYNPNCILMLKYNASIHHQNGIRMLTIDKT